MRRRDFPAIVAALALLLPGCARFRTTPAIEAAFAEAVPFCTFAQHPRDYLDRPLLISGTLINTPHDAILYDATCKGEIILRGAPSIPDDARAAAILDWQVFRENRHNRAARVPVVFRTTIVAHPKISPCDGDWCSRYIAQGAQLVAARPMSFPPQ